LADTEALAEAMDRTAKAFGQAAKPVAKPEPKPVAKPEPTPTVTANARERLAAIEAEKAAIEAEVGVKVAALVSEYGSEAVAVALRQNTAA
jgi:hypothetical protein